MNICFLIGEVVSKIDFRFILNAENKEKVSKSVFNVKLRNGSILKVYGYDEISDYCYRKLNENNTILIQGELKKKGIELENIEIMQL